MATIGNREEGPALSYEEIKAMVAQRSRDQIMENGRGKEERAQPSVQHRDRIEKRRKLDKGSLDRKKKAIASSDEEQRATGNLKLHKQPPSKPMPSNKEIIVDKADAYKDKMLADYRRNQNRCLPTRKLLWTKLMHIKIRC